MIHTNPLQIGDRLVSDSSAPYIIAEAGIHHYNSITLARKYVIEAAMAGADAIKFQTYKAEELVTKKAPTYWARPDVDSQYEMFATRSLLEEEEYAELATLSGELGIDFLSTPFDLDAVSLLDRIGVEVFKVASADITHFPMLERIAKTKKPLILSTGASTFKEVSDTCAFLDQMGADYALLHCVLSYPTPKENANLERIVQLKMRFPQKVIGYSDHTLPSESNLACPLASGLGARIIEKHFTLMPNDLRDDHYHSVDPSGLAELVVDCRNAAAMTQLSEEVLDVEAAARLNARRSIVTRDDLPANHVIQLDDLAFKRPGTGLSPADVNQVLGKKTRESLPIEHELKLEDLTHASD